MEPPSPANSKKRKHECISETESDISITNHGNSVIKKFLRSLKLLIKHIEVVHKKNNTLLNGSRIKLEPRDDDLLYGIQALNKRVKEIEEICVQHDINIVDMSLRENDIETYNTFNEFINAITLVEFINCMLTLEDRLSEIVAMYKSNKTVNYLKDIKQKLSIAYKNIKRVPSKMVSIRDSLDEIVDVNMSYHLAANNLNAQVLTFVKNMKKLKKVFIKHLQIVNDNNIHANFKKPQLINSIGILNISAENSQNNNSNEENMKEFFETLENNVLSKTKVFSAKSKAKLKQQNHIEIGSKEVNSVKEKQQKRNKISSEYVDQLLTAMTKEKKKNKIHKNGLKKQKRNDENTLENEMLELLQNAHFEVFNTNLGGHFLNDTTSPERSSKEIANLEERLLKTTNSKERFSKTINSEKSLSETTNSKGRFSETTNSKKRFPKTTNSKENHSETTNSKERLSETTSSEESLSETTSSDESFSTTTNSVSSKAKLPKKKRQKDSSKEKADNSPRKSRKNISNNDVSIQNESFFELINDIELTDHEKFLYIQQLVEEERTKSALSKTERKKLKKLVIDIDWNVPKIHTIETRIYRYPNKSELNKLKQLGAKFRVQFTREECEILTDNWKKFCEEYDFRDAKSFISFKNQKIFPLEKRLKFFQYIGRGLPDRPLSCILKRFERMFASKDDYRLGRFSPEEDTVILIYTENVRNDRKRFISLAPILRRPARSVARRYRYLKEQRQQISSTICRKAGWYTELREVICAKLLREMDTDDINELEDVEIPPHVFAKIAKEIEPPVSIRVIKFQWHVRIHAALFIKKSFCLSEFLSKIVTRLINLNITDWKCIDWNELRAPYPGITKEFIYNRLAAVLRTHSSNFKSHLQETLRTAKTKTTPKTAYVKKMLLTKNGKLKVFEEE